MEDNKVLEILICYKEEFLIYQIVYFSIKAQSSSKDMIYFLYIMDL